MDSPLPPNPYKTLNVAQDASLATIRSAHRKLVLTCHPDKFQDEAVKKQKSEQFHEVQQAYEILSDEAKRQHYDERVKLAELRAEVMEKGGSRVVPEFGSRTRPSPGFEMRGDRMYEERVPNRFREEDSRFHEHRSQPRNYDDDRYSPPAPRRSSGRVPEERRRARDMEDERYADKIYARQSAKAAEKSAKHGLEKRKDKDKRKDREAKFTSKAAYVDDGDDSDSDTTERVYKITPKRRHEDTRRRDRDEAPRRSSRREETNHTVELDSKIRFADGYIEQARRPSQIEVEPRRPAAGSRHFSAADFEPRPPPSSGPPLSPVDRRSSGRVRESRKSSPVRFSRRMTEIVDPPNTRRPNVPALSSDPRGLKHMSSSKKETPRAFTASEARIPSMRRSETMPMSSPTPRRAETAPSKHKGKSSEFVSDSGYSSPGTPPEQYQETLPPPLTKRTTYQVFGNEGHGTIYVEPEEIRDHDRKRDVSPRSHRQAERPAMATRPSSNARPPPIRSNTSILQPEPVPSSRPAPSFSRSESARVPSLPTRHSSRGEGLFGEIPYQIVNQSPRYRSSDVSYTRRIPEETSRDSYPGSHHNRPNLSRNESKAY